MICIGLVLTGSGRKDVCALCLRRRMPCGESMLDLFLVVLLVSCVY